MCYQNNDLKEKTRRSSVTGLAWFTHYISVKRLAVFCPLSIPTSVAESEDSIVS